MFCIGTCKHGSLVSNANKTEEFYLLVGFILTVMIYMDSVARKHVAASEQGPKLQRLLKVKEDLSQVLIFRMLQITFRTY